MSTINNKFTTANELFAMPSDGKRYELISGVLNMMSPAGSEHGKIAARILGRLLVHVEKHDLGEVFAAETGFLIATNPDTVRAPDVAFVSHQRLATVEPTRSFLPLAPNLVVEVVSPNDSWSEVEGKANHWLESGVGVVLVADPENETIYDYRSGLPRQELRSGDVFVAGNVCEGWQLELKDIYRIAT